jgi:hypothetical protein
MCRAPITVARQFPNVPPYHRFPPFVLVRFLNIIRDYSSTVDEAQKERYKTTIYRMYEMHHLENVDYAREAMCRNNLPLPMAS